MKSLWPIPFAALLLAALPAWPAPEADPVLSAMAQELEREFPALQHAEKVPLYYLGYEVTDAEETTLSATLGALQEDRAHRSRVLDVDARVGSPALDNTHEFKGDEAWRNDKSDPAADELPLDGDQDSIRSVLWLQTDKAYKAAQARYTEVLRNREVTAEEDDPSADFSARREKPPVYSEDAPRPKVDWNAWRANLKSLSALFKKDAAIYHSSVDLSEERDTRWLADSEGARVRTGGVFLRLSYSLSTRTDDGSELFRNKTYDGDAASDLPAPETVAKDIAVSIAELDTLRQAPLVEPYSGPAILKNRACAVFFHEILGHRLEGYRQKSEQEGQTFAKKLGQKVVASFLSVTDDPTIERFHGTFLRGFYRYDDEGVPARPAVLIQDGVLKGFLMSRSPIRGFPYSNGHGRSSPGRFPEARMGNTIVTASKTVPYPELRRMLLRLVKRQHKPYGLIFDDIDGGYTETDRSGPQAFKVLPLLVYRVYPDGRPDQVVRGVDVVGTPLTSFTKIVAAADDPDVFDGTCGAESGWVPVSAVAPSVLISELEVEKKEKSEEKPPVLPPPYADAGAR